MFIELHSKKNGAPFLVNADSIDWVSEDGVLSARGEAYDVRESYADLVLLLDPRRTAAKPAAPRVQVPRVKAS